MSRVLVLGGSGMLGHKMFQTLTDRFASVKCSLSGPISPELSALGLFQPDRTIQNLDVRDWPQVQEILRDERPDFLVNCVGVIKQRDAAHDPVASISINSLLPHLLGECCREWGGRIIHFSTDCVFSGKDGSYTEESISDAEDLYGKSKFLGEVQSPNAFTIRTSIIGHELKNFASLLEWFLAQDGGTVSGFRKVIYSGVTTNFLARIVGDLIESNPDLNGLFQVTSDPISKFDLLTLVRDTFGLAIEIIPEVNTVCDRSMLGDRFEGSTGLKTPPWPKLVAELAEEYPKYAAWRPE